MNSYLLIGTIVALVGMGLMATNLSYLGMIIGIVGIAICIKGRNKIDKRNLKK